MAEWQENLPGPAVKRQSDAPALAGSVRPGAHEDGMPAKSSPRIEPAGAEYFYRRSLSAREVLPAIGVGVVVGAAAFYLAHIFLQRTPLVPRPGSSVTPRARSIRTIGG